MPYTLNPTGFAALAISPGMLSEDAYIFLAPDSGVSGLLTAYLNYHSGNIKPLYSLRQTYSVLNGSGSPTSGVGYSGDLYINTADQTLWGPKTSDVLWPTGYVSLVGAAGSGVSGAAGASGAVGQGVPASGLTNQALVKVSNTSYDTEWKDVIDIFHYPKRNNILDYSLMGQSSQLLDSSFSPISGRSVFFDSSSETFLVCSENDSKLYQYNRSFEFIREISFADGSGSRYSIKKIINTDYGMNYLILLYSDGVSTTKIRHYRLLDFTNDDYNQSTTLSYVSEIDTGLGPTVNLSNLCYNPRTDSYYFCSKSSISSGTVWNLYRYRDATLTSVKSLIPTVLGTGLFGTDAAGEAEIWDMDFNYGNNTILFYCSYGTATHYIYQLGVDSDDNFEEILEDGLEFSFLNVSDVNLEDSSSYSMHFSFKDGLLFLLDKASLPDSTKVTCFTNSFATPFANNRTSKSLTAYSFSLDSVVPQKTCQYIDKSNDPFPSISFGNVSNTAFSSYSIGNAGNFGGIPSVGQTIRVESYGNLTANKDSSIFPSNDQAANTGYQGGLTGSYYLSLPSGLSAPWKYTTEVVCKGRYTTGNTSPHIYRKALFGHFEVFSTPKLELFYLETGLFAENNTRKYLIPAFKWAASGSGTLTLLNSRTFFM